jgi:hypothetical protein
MNFKFTLWKSIVSFITFIFVDFFIGNSSTIQCSMQEGGYCPRLVWYNNLFDSGSLIVGLAIGLVVYIVWSLIQKKKRK